MKFGIGLAPFDRWGGIEEIERVVEAADRLGFGYVTMPDLVLVPDGPEQPRSGVVFPDIIPLAAFLAARTSSVRLVFSALVVRCATRLSCQAGGHAGLGVGRTGRRGRRVGLAAFGVRGSRREL